MDFSYKSRESKMQFIMNHFYNNSIAEDKIQ